MTDEAMPKRARRLLDRNDRWLIRPAAFALVVLLAFAFLSKLPGDVSFTLPLVFMLLVVPAASLTLILLIGLMVARKTFRKAVSLLLIFPLAVALWRPILWVADYLHLAVAIGSLDKNGEFQVWDWSVGLAGGETTLLIRDPSDEIALPPSQLTHPVGRENGVGESCGGRVRHMISHYYLCAF